MIGRLRVERGSTLILTFLIFVVLTLLGSIVYKTTRTLLFESVFQVRLAQSRAIAEAGMEDALHQLVLSSSWRAGFSQKAFGGGSYTVTLTSATPPVITSVGLSPALALLGSAHTTLTTTALITQGASTCPTISGTAKLFLQGTSDSYDSSVSPTPSSFVFGGNVCSNNQVQIQNGSTVNGNVSYGVAPAPSASSVLGSITLLTSAQTVAYHDGSGYVLLNNNLLGISPILSYNVLTGQLNVPSGNTVTFAPGIYYLNGLILNSGSTIIANNTLGAVTIYLNGDMSINGTFTNVTKLPNRLLIYPQGSNNISLQTSSAFYGVIEGTNASIFTSGATVFGRLAGASLNLANNTTLHYDVQSGGGGSAAVTHVGVQTGTWASSPD